MSRVRLNIAHPEVLPPDPSLSEDEASVFLVGDLAKAAGKTVRAIHLYEDMGLLKPERSKGRYRIFGSDALVRVRWITKLQNLGFSLAEIQQLTRAHDGSESAKLAAAKLRAVYVAKLDETRDKLEELKRLESELIESLHYLGNCDTSCQPQLPVNACPTCERHPENTNPPDLVVGAQTH